MKRGANVLGKMIEEVRVVGGHIMPAVFGIGNSLVAKKHRTRPKDQMSALALYGSFFTRSGAM